MSSSKKSLLWLLSLVFSFIVGFGLANKISLDNLSQYKNGIIRKNFNYKFINPILECNPDIGPSNNLSSLKNSLQQIITNKINQKDISFASVYFRDLNNGPWIGINEKEYFSPASMIKVPILMTYLKKAESNPEILQQKIINTVDPETGSNIQNIKPTIITEPNKEYTIKDLLERMIIYSDNDAYNDLTSHLDNQELSKIYKDLDIDISKAFSNPDGNIITVKDYASFYRILFNASYLDQDMSEKALEILSRSQFKDGLVAGVPQGITIAHKFGERKYLDSGETQLHDCGIIYAPNKPYLLCIMTKSKDITKATNTIKEISQTTYQVITQN